MPRRKELYERQHPETKHGAVSRRGKSRQNVDSSDERYTKTAADETGQDERTVQRSVKRGKSIPNVADLAE